MRFGHATRLPLTRKIGCDPVSDRYHGLSLHCRLRQAGKGYAMIDRRLLARMARARSVATLLLLAFSACRCSPADRPEPRARAPVRVAADASVLVLTHSWSGRTAIVGRAWADMLGARFLRFSDAPDMYSSAGVHGLTREEILPELDLVDVRRIYLGFPIWSRGPAPPAWRLISELDLSGVQIVPSPKMISSIW